MLDPSLLQDFIAETNEHLEEMEDNLLQLEKSPDNPELINSIFRSVHTIKGSAEYLGMEKISSLTHNLESLLDRIRNGNQDINRKIIDVVISSGDVISRLVEDLIQEGKEQTPIDGPLGQIVRILEQDGSSEPDPEESVAAELTLPIEDEAYDEELFSIFVQNLREGLTEFKKAFSKVNTGSDLPEVLNKCLEMIVNLASSANYMGYDQLSSLYGDLKADVEAFHEDAMEPGESPLIDQTITAVEKHISGICSLFNIQEADLDVSTALSEQSVLTEEVTPQSLLDDDRETPDFNLDGPVLEEENVTDSTETGSPDPDLAEEADALSEKHDHTVFYKEDYDAELFDIFTQQLREDFEWFISDADTVDASADHRKTIDAWKDKLASLRSSSNYMGYGRLSRIYENWEKQLDAVIENASSGNDSDWQKQLRSSAAETMKKIAAFFPQVDYLKDVVVEMNTSALVDENDLVNAESLDESASAFSLPSDLNDALNDKISGMTMHADTPHEIVSNYLFTDVAVPASFDPLFDGEIEDPSADRTDESTIRESKITPTSADSLLEERQSSDGGMDAFADILQNDATMPDEAGIVANTELDKESINPEDASAEAAIDTGKDDKKAEESASNFSSRIRSQSIRVDSNKIDALMNQVGELVVSRAWFSQLHHEMRELKQKLLQEENIDKRLAKQINQMTFRLYEATGSLGRAANELQEGVMRIRMLPVARLFNRYPRLIHDLVKDIDKQVDLEIRGEDTELDKMVIEKISDPMIHIIRNAIDHGIENRSERLINGKPETAKLIIEAYHESNHVVIEVTDDGSGIDPEKVKAKALEKNFMEAIELDRLTDREAIALITKPGFSTATEITHTSGRGVGMDVVKKNIEKLNGTVEIDSTTGKETRIRIKIPLTLAIIPALLVRVEPELFTIPLSTVEETIKVDVKDIESIEGNEVIYLRNQTIPLIRLNKVFNMPTTNGGDQKIFIVIVSNGMNQMGLVVDSLLGQEEVVIKPLEDYLQESSGFSGATILGDGRISLILDIYDLLNISIAKMEHSRRMNTAVTA